MTWVGPKRCWEELAQAIVLQVAEDYRDALLDMRRTSLVDPYTHAQLLECRRFFHSWWCHTLTTLDTDKLMEDIEKEVKKNDRERISGTGHRPAGENRGSAA